MSHHPTCKELHANTDAANALDWQPHDGERLHRELIWTCVSPVCTNTVYRFWLTTDDRYAITRTDESTGVWHIYQPADSEQGSTLNTWLDLVKPAT